MRSRRTDAPARVTLRDGQECPTCMWLPALLPHTVILSGQLMLFCAHSWSAATCRRFGFCSGLPGEAAGVATPSANEKESGDKSPHSKVGCGPAALQQLSRELRHFRVALAQCGSTVLVAAPPPSVGRPFVAIRRLPIIVTLGPDIQCFLPRLRDSPDAASIPPGASFDGGGSASYMTAAHPLGGWCRHASAPTGRS